MATVDLGSGSGGGKGKPLNVEYNLVPFIDLLCCMIAFLLMTAVWTQISMIQTNEGTSDASPTQKKDDFILALYVYDTHQDLAMGDKSSVRIPKVDNNYDLARLNNELLSMKEKHPDKRDILILAQDKVKYKELIASMDTCLGVDIPNITVSGMLE